MSLEKTLFIKTYGCQMNVYDSIKMQDLLTPYGYSVTEIYENANVVILNTCHIREKAAEKVYSELGRIREAKNKMRSEGKYMHVVVAGCVGQAEGEEIFSRAPFVDIVVGPQSYQSLPALISQIENGAKQLIKLDFVDEAKFDDLPIETTNQGASAFISIQEGCDKFCTFCVVPYTRGAEFSRPLENIYRETLDAVQKGSKEIVLLGQNVNAYHGKSFDGNEVDLAALIDHISTINGLERIKYLTSHPRDMKDNLIHAHGSNPKLMPYLHLPVQSGSNNILKAMNRKHTREEYLDIISKLRSERPDIIFSSDFIVGFPGETDEDFADTIDLVKTVQYGQCYSFKYSPRPGTPAATKEQVPEYIKDERLRILQTLLMEQLIESNKNMVGKTIPVLFEKDGKFEDQLVGKTPYMQSAYINNAPQNLVGAIAPVKITGVKTVNLEGELVY